MPVIVEKKMMELEKQEGWTLIEVLSVCVLIGLLAAFAIPSYMQARRVVFEDNAIGRLQRLALAESRFYAEYGRFGDFTELQVANMLPEGYSTTFSYRSPVSTSSVLPFIDRYSLTFHIPNSANSLYYKIDAVPVANNQMGLRTFNINLFVTGVSNPDNLMSQPPIREGLEVDGRIVNKY